jgi:polysaccharide deacetylase family protein (PEP-CTERM system associated)
MRPSPSVLRTKRLFDIAIGLFGTGCFIVAYPILSLLIKWENPGPALYAQERVGINKRRRRRQGDRDGENDAGGLPVRRSDVGGRPFTIYKFRSMRTDAEKAGPQFATKGRDPRITRIGWWLRATHLDELPQFWNILRGDMSFIGPRPERAHFTTQFQSSIPHYRNRTLFLKPGLTGLAQITVGYDDSIESVVRKTFYDYSYRASMSHFKSWIRMELWVLLHTAGYLLKPLRKEGEVRELESLKRAQQLGLTAKSEEKSTVHKVTAWVSMRDGDHTTVLVGQDVSEIGRKLDRLSSRGVKTMEVGYAPSPDFDLDEMGFLVELAQHVRRVGGQLRVRDATARVRRMLQEIHMDKVVAIERGAGEVKNFFTVDVECWFHAFNLRDKVPPSTWHEQETRVRENVERILQLLSGHDAKGTFFVLGWVADKYPEVVKMIDAAGHEIGSHGYYHNLITEMTPAAFEEDLLKSIRTITQITGKPIVGHRASNFTVVRNTLWALDILANHGFEYDSSIFPIERDRYGIPNYPNRLPHAIHLKDNRQIFEFPMSTLGVGKKFLPMSGGGYLRLFPHQITEGFIEAQNAKGHPVMLYLHPWELDTQQQRIRTGMVKSFQHYVNLHSTEWKISRLLQRFQFGSIQELRSSRRVQLMLQRNPIYIGPADQDGVELQKRSRMRPAEPSLTDDFTVKPVVQRNPPVAVGT